MNRVYLVEDEIHALRGLSQKIIDLEKDYEIVGTADNGMTALTEISRLRPDIVLTDIRMPDMDGLALIEQLNAAKNPPMTIIVSGFQDFEYAKQAVRLGASDYLLKPVNPAELDTALSHCVELLKKKRKNILSFLIGDERLSFETVSGQDSFAISYMILGNPLSSMESFLHPAVPYFPNEEMEQLFQKYYSCPSIRCYDGFFSNEKLFLFDHEEKNRKLLKKSLEHFAGALEERTGSNVTLYYTMTCGNALPSAIRQSRNNAVKNTILGKTTVCDSPAPTQTPTPNLSSDAELYAMLLAQGQQKQLHSNILRLFQSWETEGRTWPALMDDMSFLVDSLKRNFRTKKSLTFSSAYLLENIVSFSRDMESLAENFEHLLVELFARSDPESKSGEELVNTLIEYFTSHLSSNISLQDLEEVTGFSKVYICRVFKKEKNSTPIDYFTRLKVDRAAGLLKAYPNLSLREISDSLGFNDVYYFSKVFKKIYGCSPSDVRKMQK